MSLQNAAVEPWAVLLVAHGTVQSLDEIPAFLQSIRRGRPANPELVAEMRHRYEVIGGSPLDAVTARQAAGLSRELGVPVFWGMRLWKPWLAEVIGQQLPCFQRLCVLPLAPFSVHVYAGAAQEAAAQLLPAGDERLVAVEPWGSHPGFVRWFAEQIRERGAGEAGTRVVLTAHSLPTRVIAAGDPYAAQVHAAAQLVEAELGVGCSLAYQSQGADGGDWQGPDLRAVLMRLREEGATRVVVAPLGFVAEHVETLFDLDIEAARWAEELGLAFCRVPAPNDAPQFVAVLADVARAAMRKVE